MNIHCALEWTLYTGEWTLHASYCTVHYIHCTALHSVHIAQWTNKVRQCTCNKLLKFRTMYNLHYTLHAVYCTLHNTRYTLHCTLYLEWKFQELVHDPGWDEVEDGSTVTLRITALLRTFGCTKLHTTWRVENSYEWRLLGFKILNYNKCSVQWTECCGAQFIL